MNQVLSYKLGKNERLKSRKLIEELFNCGASVSIFPIRVIYKRLENASGCNALQAGFTVGTKHFKKATDRNRIRRLMREAYRLQKLPLKQSIIDQNRCYAIFFIYIGKDIPEYIFIEQKMKTVLKKVQLVVST